MHGPVHFYTKKGLRFRKLCRLPLACQCRSTQVAEQQRRATLSNKLHLNSTVLRPTISLFVACLWNWLCSSFILVAAASDTAAATANVHRGRELHLCVQAAKLLGGLADATVLPM